MKKILAIVFVLIGCVTFIACGSSEPPKPKEAYQTYSDTTYTYADNVVNRWKTSVKYDKFIKVIQVDKTLMSSNCDTLVVHDRMLNFYEYKADTVFRYCKILVHYDNGKHPAERRYERDTSKDTYVEIQYENAGNTYLDLLADDIYFSFNDEEPERYRTNAVLYPCFFGREASKLIEKLKSSKKIHIRLYGDFLDYPDGKGYDYMFHTDKPLVWD